MLQPILWITIQQLFIKPPPPFSRPTSLTNRKFWKYLLFILFLLCFFLPPNYLLLFYLFFSFTCVFPTSAPIYRVSTLFILLFLPFSFWLLSLFALSFSPSISLYIQGCPPNCVSRSLTIHWHPGVSAELCVSITYLPGVSAELCVPLSLTIQGCPPNCVSSITYHPGVSAELCVLSTHNPEAASIHLTTFCN